MESSTKSIEIFRLADESIEPTSDCIAVEEPLEIQAVSGSDRKILPISVTMRTPGNDEELAVGFLFTEGIVKEREQIIGIEKIADNVVRVELGTSVTISRESLSRNFYTTSSCGVCGKASIDAIKVNSRVIGSNFSMPAEVLQSLPEALLSAQANFKSTGGLHASALFTALGELKLIREDVGRHNALDKLIGHLFLQNATLIHESVLLVSGRLSFELVQKAAVAGIPFVAAIGAPSSLAVELAEEKGITLVGFLNSNRFNIYTHQNRVILHEPSRV